jgi:uncharacterized membrane protein YgaE (UPF0421/DUF939 family)
MNARDPHQRRARDMEQGPSSAVVSVIDSGSSNPPCDNEKEEKERNLLMGIGGCCCRFVSARFNKASEHGGDARSRLQRAARAALGSLTHFSLLMFPQQQYLGAVWIGNIFFHVCLSGNLGSSITKVQGCLKSVILTTCWSYPFAVLMQAISTTMAEIILPPLIFCISFLIMSCPWLTYRNLMILVMYIVVAAPVREDVKWWTPFGYLGSYSVGLSLSVLMNLVPPWSPNTATKAIHELLQRFEKDSTLLFLQTRSYMNHAGQDSEGARAAIAAIELYVGRIDTTIKDIQAILPAVITEVSWVYSTSKAAVILERLERWTDHLEQQTTHYKMLRTALKQRMTGEQGPAVSGYARKVRRIIAQQVGEPYRELLDALIATMVDCNEQADPQSSTSFSSSSSSSFSRKTVNATELFSSLNTSRQAFARALDLATRAVNNDEHLQEKETPNFAHLARRMTSFHSVFSIAEDLAVYVHQNNQKASHESAHADNCSPTSTTLRQRILSVGRNHLVVTWLKPKWLWHNIESRRLALKTALGMFFASLWISIPFLWDIAQPWGVWPGLTIASVNLATTGSSFHKAIDRLFGTLIAAAFASLVADFFPGNQDYVKIPFIAVFTFAVIFLQKSEHAYQYQYAATSIGSMLYGSVKNDFDVTGYIPKRIQVSGRASFSSFLRLLSSHFSFSFSSDPPFGRIKLIFVGVITFALIELFIFPRSSRRIMERKSLEFFPAVHSFLLQATDFTTRMEFFVRVDEEEEDLSSGGKNRCSRRETEAEEEEREPAVCTLDVDCLLESHKKVKSISSVLTKELASALDEPYFGFSQPLDSAALVGLTKEIAHMETQAFLLVDALRKLSHYYQQENASLRYMNWPQTYAALLQKVTTQMNRCCNILQEVYPDGRLRPQAQNSLPAMVSAASFREFDDVRLEIISRWSQDYYTHFCQLRNISVEGSDPKEIMTLGITTSFILELCRHLQKCGKNMEENARNFPPPA